MRRITAILVLPLAIALAACSQPVETATPTSTATPTARPTATPTPSESPSQAPETGAPATKTPEPSNTPAGGDPELAAMIPESVGELTLLVQTMTAAEMAELGVPMDSNAAAIAALGADIDDVSFAMAGAGGSDASVQLVAVKIGGADPELLEAAWLDSLRAGQPGVDTSFTETTLGDKQVLVGSVAAGMGQTTIYVSGDTVFMLSGTPDLVAELLEQLP